ncbi:lipase family protein [Mucilaginibacter jinjuensis]|uniref:Fungal lipase-type domain-containing protein n=1 Tax=Mucilaginibacter jinjuensis TaxID=1176721 RepID=A0ABY7T964_9SPHI|nr:hypothetical protein [Mucilaginibacter jinjuensis]WCT12961.1 hypothetical protein PQO05_03310 [Mucilaginibacter jinjuensis]
MLLSLIPINVRLIFALSMLSNIPAATTGNSEQIVKYAKPKIQQALASAPSVDSVQLSGWQLVWGPAVIAKPGSKQVDKELVASNAMSIFKNGNTYVIGIQATNSNSTYDWLVEDGNVRATVPWNVLSPATKAPATAVVSKGTSIGLNTLLDSLQDDSSHLSAVQYLQGQKLNQQSGAQVIVTGHSLGGALSPSLALYLKDNPAAWNAGNTAVYCLSTAGPTPGNGDFATYYNAQLQNNTQRIWNDLDVVPRAWVQSLLTQVQSNVLAKGGLYSAAGASIVGDSVYCSPYKKGAYCGSLATFNPLGTPLDVDALIEGAKKWSGDKYMHICGNGLSFHGVQNGPYIDVIVGAKGYPKGIGLFMQQMAQQHVIVYNFYFNIMPIHEYVRTMVEKDPKSVVNRNFNNKQSEDASAITSFPELLGRMSQYAWAW